VKDIAKRIEHKPSSFVYWLRHYFQIHLPEIARLAEAIERKNVFGYR
jgi:hypothetical protein